MTRGKRWTPPGMHPGDLPTTTVEEVMAAFQKGGPNAIGWYACARRCDHCGKRRLTYQLVDGFYCNDRLCSECLIRQALAEREPPPDEWVSPMTRDPPEHTKAMRWTHRHTR